MDDYKPNSYKYKEQQKALTSDKKIEKVVKGTVKTRKRNGVTKLKDVFVNEDAKNVKSYIFSDVLVPAIKKLLYDIVNDGASMLLFGNTSSGRKKTIGSNVSYRQFYDSKVEDRRPVSSSRFDYEDLIFESRGEAEAALSKMDEVIDVYGTVSVADLYDMCDLTAPYTSNRYGWSNIQTAEVARLRDGGYVLKLPRALPISK